MIGAALTPVIFLFIIILAACMLVLDFFGTSSTDGYVENNLVYAKDYKNVLNENIINGYVPLERLLDFYLAKDNFSFAKIYNDNLNLEIKRMKPLSEVCTLPEYRYLSICSYQNFRYGQNSGYQAKPFAMPIDFSNTTITSFFMEQRIVFGSYDIHKAWDLASPAETEVLSVCDGVVIESSYKYKENKTDTSGGLGNHVSISCNVDGTVYKVTYGHLFPSNKPIAVGTEVIKNQVIGKVGTTGYSTGNHLHYQVQTNDNKYVDGMSLIDFSPGAEIPEDPKPGYNPFPDRPNIGY